MAKAGQRLGNAKFVQYGFGQVEPNHLSAPQNGQVYGQLPASADIAILENGQFVKYDYAKGVCHYMQDVTADGGPNYSTSATAGEWMLVFNEVKLYRDREDDGDFAMIKQNYNARVYSPIGQTTSALKTIVNYGADGARREGTNEPFVKQMETFNYPQNMPEGTNMVPRVLRTQVGDIFTTNCIDEEPESLNVGDILAPTAGTGYLSKTGDTAAMKWAVVKVYTMPDLQPGVKIQRIA